VVTVLHGYQDTAAWKAQFKAALDTQNAAVVKVNADPNPASTSALADPVGLGNGVYSSVHGPRGGRGMAPCLVVQLHRFRQQRELPDLHHRWIGRGHWRKPAGNEGKQC
jgi:hypothetical protein